MVSYAYIHCKPDGVPFYVGKGALRRAKYLGERNPHHQATVNKHGKDNILIGMLECSSSKTAYELEAGIIKCLKRMGVRLTNFTAGGDGGREPCEETRKRLSEAAKKRGVSQACQEAKVAALKGRKLTAEQRAKQSAVMTGKVFTEEHRRNISISAKKRGMSRAVINAAKTSNIGRIKSDKEKESQRVAMLAAWDKKGRKPRPEPKTGNCWDTRETRGIYVDGVFYKKMSDAAKEIGVHSASIVYAIKNSGVTKGRRVSVNP